MATYNQQEVSTQNKVKFTITPDGKIEFDANNIDELQLTEAIVQARATAQEGRKARQKMEEIKSATQLASHIIFTVFIALVVGGTTFSCSRLVSTQFNQPTMEIKK